MNEDNSICFGANFYLDGNSELHAELRMKNKDKLYTKVIKVNYEHNLELDFLIKKIYEESKQK